MYGPEEDYKKECRYLHQFNKCAITFTIGERANFQGQLWTLAIHIYRLTLATYLPYVQSQWLPILATFSIYVQNIPTWSAVVPYYHVSPYLYSSFNILCRCAVKIWWLALSATSLATPLPALTARNVPVNTAQTEWFWARPEKFSRLQTVRRTSGQRTAI